MIFRRRIVESCWWILLGEFLKLKRREKVIEMDNWLRFLEEQWWFTYCCSSYCMQLATLWKSDCRARENLARSIHNSLGFLPGAALRMVELYLDIVSMRLMHYLPSCPTIYNKQEYFTREWRATEGTDEIPWKLVEPSYFRTIDAHRC